MEGSILAVASSQALQNHFVGCSVRWVRRSLLLDLFL